jgi:hypothetical protein
MWGLLIAVPLALAVALVGTGVLIALLPWLSEGRWRGPLVMLWIWPYMFAIAWLAWLPIALATGSPLLGSSR